MGNSLKQRWTNSYRENWRKQDTTRMAMGLALGLMTCAGQAASSTKGYNVLYAAGTQSTGPLRKIGHGLLAGLSLSMLLANGNQLLIRIQEGHIQPHGIGVNETQELAVNIVSNSATSLSLLRELSTGRSLVHGYPLSRYGTVFKAISLVASAYTLGGNAKHLYDRREQWLPEFQELAFDLKLHMASPVHSMK